MDVGYVDDYQCGNEVKLAVAGRCHRELRLQCPRGVHGQGRQRQGQTNERSRREGESPSEKSWPPSAILPMRQDWQLADDLLDIPP